MLKDHARGQLNNPDYVVIFFHQYGGNGKDTAEQVANLLSPVIPGVKVIAPDATDPVPGDPVDGPWRQWFFIKDQIDNPTPTPDRGLVAYRAMQEVPKINAYIDSVIAREKIDPSRVIVAGFSQGATMAVYAALSREKPVGAVFSISGGAIDQLPHIESRTPTVLLAGEREQNEYSGVYHLPMAQARLAQAGVPHVTGVLPGVGHDISPQAMQRLSVLIRHVTAEDPVRKVGDVPNSSKPYRL